ncbi:MAG: aconitase X catalytic domain-containing protein [Chloroflexota bacterium]|nr:aconitase X catalytic domain-containing protein [Chloroflexota bacterium]
MSTHLTPKERAMLAGEYGPGVKKAMEIVVALGKIYGAKELVPIASAQVAGVSYKNLGGAGLDFLRELVEGGARARVSAMLNPAGMDLTGWRELGIPEDFARKQMKVIETFKEMDITPTCSCTPYLIGHAPSLGEHIAWSESSAVSFANSVLGARTNREGGPGALAAAITGRTAAYGLHLDESRRANFIVEVRCPVETAADFGALGYIVGRQVKNAVPYFKPRRSELVGTKRRFAPTASPKGAEAPTTNNGKLKALGAAMAAGGAVALYHVEGVTPEAMGGDIVASNAETIIIESLGEGYAALNSSVEKIDLASIGCPHASLGEIEEVARWLIGKRVKAALWLTTSRRVKELAEKQGFVEIIEAAGGKVVADTCLVVAPVEALGFRSMATNSAKMAFYAPSHCGLEVRFGPLEQCLKAAVRGRWPSV